MKYGFSAWLAILSCVVFAATSHAAEQMGRVFTATSTVHSGGQPTGPGDPIHFRDRLPANSTGIGEFTFLACTEPAPGSSAKIVPRRAMSNAHDTIMPS
jgi:hypothetical protein